VDGRSRAFDRVLVVVEDAENVRAGKDCSEFERELGRVGAGAELASVTCSSRLDLEEVSPFLLVGRDEVTGRVDVRGTLNIDPDVRVGFESMRMEVRLRAAPAAPARLLERLRVGGERLCVTLDTLRTGVQVEAKYEIAAT
jgi:hypothetical protein